MGSLQWHFQKYIRWKVQFTSLDFWYFVIQAFTGLSYLPLLSWKTLFGCKWEPPSFVMIFWRDWIGVTLLETLISLGSDPEFWNKQMSGEKERLWKRIGRLLPQRHYHVFHFTDRLFFASPKCCCCLFPCAVFSRVTRLLVFLLHDGVLAEPNILSSLNPWYSWCGKNCSDMRQGYRFVTTRHTTALYSSLKAKDFTPL